MRTFTRDPGPLRLAGVRVVYMSAVTDLLLRASPPSDLIVADLSLGAWRSYQVACEFSAQLGLTKPTPGPPPAELTSRPDWIGMHASRIGRLIDSETCGDRIVLEALRLATEIVNVVFTHDPTTFCVFVGCRGIPWEPGDTLFVRFLAQALQSSAHRLILVTCGPPDPDLPQDWTVTWSDAERVEPSTPNYKSEDVSFLIPGVITPQLAELLYPVDTAIRSLIRLRGGCFLVPPMLRRELHVVTAEQYDQLAFMAQGVSWLAAYANCHGSDQAVNPSFLWEHARREFEAGGFGITIRLLRRAISLARTPAERGLFELLAQGARIASGRLNEAARAHDPDQSIPAKLRAWLWHTKGWALTTMGKSPEAEECLMQARDLVQQTGDTEEYMYVLNISALNLLKMDNWAGALALEEKIRSAIEGIVTGGWQLRYINSLNLARLHKRRHIFESAERYYREAFATTFGVRSDSDAIYMNVSLALLNEARGRYADAFEAWVHAALHWVSSPVPEAIANRVVSAILASVRRTEANLIDGVSAALTLHLVSSAKAARLDREVSAVQMADPANAVTFVRSDRIIEGLTSTNVWHALHGPGCWVLGAEAEVHPIISSAANRHLRSTLFSLLLLTNCTNRQLRTIVVDDSLGRDIPRKQVDLLAACLRLLISALVIDGHVLHLGETNRDWLERHLRIRVSSAIDQLWFEAQEAFVTFKRYRHLQKLSNLAARVLILVAEAELTVEDLSIALATNVTGSAMPLLRSLERDRILELLLPGEVSLPISSQVA